jgi:DNA adenine methylase
MMICNRGRVILHFVESLLRGGDGIVAARHRPFLKWAGNKYQILENIKAILPHGNRLIEPFVGSGAVFLNTNYGEYLLADNNEDLINLFLILKREGEPFIN